jgi:hypothetical protein
MNDLVICSCGGGGFGGVEGIYQGKRSEVGPCSLRLCEQAIIHYQERGARAEDARHV